MNSIIIRRTILIVTALGAVGVGGGLVANRFYNQILINSDRTPILGFELDSALLPSQLRKDTESLVKKSVESYVYSTTSRSWVYEAPSVLDAFNIVKTISEACTKPPITLDIGREVYPILESYRQLPFLGEIFTQAKCGRWTKQELQYVPTVDDGNSWGSSLTLRPNPSEQLVKTLKEIGYTCDETNSKDDVCEHWSLQKYVSIEAVLRLEPFADEMIGEDCINCG
jgi:hypothetical protein